MYIFLDIETIPGIHKDKYNQDNPIDIGKVPTIDDMKPAGNIKDEEKKQADKEKKLRKALIDYDNNKEKLLKEHEEKYRKLALYPTTGKIISINAIFEDGDTFRMTLGHPNKEGIAFNKEKSLIGYFIKTIQNKLSEKELDSGDIQFVGHNVIFDINFIRQRLMLYYDEFSFNIKITFPTYKYSDNIVDTGTMLDPYNTHNYIKLDTLCNFFGIDGKYGIDGSQVYDYYMNNRLKEIHEYCYDDTYKVLQLFIKMAPMNNMSTGILPELIKKGIIPEPDMKPNKLNFNPNIK